MSKIDLREYANADKKLIKKLAGRKAFDPCLDTPVSIEKVNVDVMCKWVGERLTELLGFEDEVIINLVIEMISQRTDAYSGQVKRVDPRQLQVQLTGFLEKQAAPFVAELWQLLIDAQESPHGIPKAFVDRKKKQMLKQRAAKSEDSKAVAARLRQMDTKKPETLEEKQRRLVLAAGGEASNGSKRARGGDADGDDAQRARQPERRRRRSEDEANGVHWTAAAAAADGCETQRADSNSKVSSTEPCSATRSGNEGRDARRDAAVAAAEARPELPAGWEWRESRSQKDQWYCLCLKTGEKRWEAPAVIAKCVARHVLVKHAESKNPKSWRDSSIDLPKDEALAEILQIRATVLNASDRAKALEKIARERSDCPSASKGGQLKPFAKGELDRAFEKAAFALEPNALSEVVDTASGLHIILRLA